MPSFTQSMVVCYGKPSFFELYKTRNIWRLACSRLCFISIGIHLYTEDFSLKLKIRGSDACDKPLSIELLPSNELHFEVDE